jgi:hypothetical protein
VRRLEFLKDLVAFNKPVEILADGLSQLDWDYEGQPLAVTASQIRSILQRFLAGKFSAKDLEDWANLIECREDLEFEGNRHEAIENVIFCLANPRLQGEITPALCENLLNTLSE